MLFWILCLILRLFSFGHSCNMWIIVSWACWLHWLHIGGGSFLRRCLCVSLVWPILSLAIIILSFLVFRDEVCHLHVSSFIFFSLLLLSGTDLQNSFHFSLILFLLCCLRSLHSIISLTYWSCLVSFASLSACSFPGICLWLAVSMLFLCCILLLLVEGVNQLCFWLGHFWFLSAEIMLIESVYMSMFLDRISIFDDWICFNNSKTAASSAV